MPEMDRRFDIVALGEAMVEFNQTSERQGKMFLQGFGGDTSNAVIAAARQGARCAYITHLGDDEFGQMLLNLWTHEGVSTEAVTIHDTAPTGLYFVTHGPEGHRFSYRRANSAASLIQPQDLQSIWIQDARALHVSGISQAISSGSRQTVRHALRMARSAGTRISYDPNLRLKLWTLDEARQEIIATIAQCDVFLPSIDDVQTVSGLDDAEEIVRWCHDQGAPLVVLKLGPDGCLVSDGRTLTNVPGFAVHAIDATGAGDCFDGSFLTHWLQHDNAVSAARWACAAAAISTTGYGAVDPLPSTSEVQQLMGN